MMTTRVSSASSQPKATRLEGGAHMPLLLGPFLPPSLPTSTCHPISTMPYLYPFFTGVYLFNKYHLHTYFGLEDTESKGK